MSLKERIDLTRLPSHVAVIMDGNGRWAGKLGKTRIFGHMNGVSSVRNTTEACAELGVRFLTLYAFSTENWHRPKTEVSALMQLLLKTIKSELKTLLKNDIRLRVIGDIAMLPAGIIITGGGAGLGTIEDLARASLRLPSRVGSIHWQERTTTKTSDKTAPSANGTDRSTERGGVERIRDKQTYRDATWAVAYGLCIFGASAEGADTVGGSGTRAAGTAVKSFTNWVRQFLP